MKKILIILMIIAVVFSASVLADDTYDKYFDLQQDKDWVDKKLEQTIRERKEYQDDKNFFDQVASQMEESLVAQMEDLLEKEGTVEALEAEIDELSQTISDAEKEYAQKLLLLKNRIIDGYIDSQINLLTILTDSKNITEFYEKLELRKYVARYDQGLIEDIELLAADMAQKKARAEALQLQYERAVETTKMAIGNLEEIKERAEATSKMSAERIAFLKAVEDRLEEESEALLATIQELQQKMQYVGGDMVWPVPSNRRALDKGDFFGQRLHPIFHEWRMHTGIDIGARNGANIVAANSGTVIITKWSNSGYGNRVVIDHGISDEGGIVTLYSHCSKILVKQGQKVEKGQVIALIGSTGWATGPHLHFEVIVNGTRVDPLNYVNQLSGTKD